ncbi:GSCOCG00007653001-RA-CDS [Cotesia congregata]|nr:GSCOCG00007653001-RA-CDS [Cotesia congregata]
MNWYLLVTSLQFVFEIIIVTASWWRSTTSTLVKLRDDGFNNFSKLFLLLFVFFRVSILVFFKPLNFLVNSSLYFFLVFLRDFRSKLFFIGNIDTFFKFFVFIGKLLSIFNHSFDVIRCKSVLIIGNNNFLTVTSSLIFSRYLQNTVSINFEGYFNLRNSSGCWWDTGKIKFTKKMVIFGHWTFSLINLNCNGMLIVGCSREDL